MVHSRAMIPNLLLSAVLTVGVSPVTPARGGPGGWSAECFYQARVSPNPTAAKTVCADHIKREWGHANDWTNSPRAQACLKAGGLVLVGGILAGIGFELVGGEVVWGTTARQVISGAVATCITVGGLGS
jgi:hypothetical protein